LLLAAFAPPRAHAHPGDVVEERFRRPRPDGDVDQDARGARITATLSSVADDHSDSLVARARDPEPVGPLSDSTADLRNGKERIVELQDEVHQLRSETSGRSRHRTSLAGEHSREELKFEPSFPSNKLLLGSGARTLYGRAVDRERSGLTSGRRYAVAPIVHSVEISRRPEDVFAQLSDVPSFSDWQEGVVSARVEGGGPMGPGAKVTFTRRVLGGREQTMTSELTDFAPPRSFAFRGIDGPIRARGRGTVEPVGEDRSRFTFELDFEGRGIGKLLVPLVRRQARKEIPITHENLKRRLESGAA
jgi:Polyketide cyclase / dehydrase and lipid transport